MSEDIKPHNPKVRRALAWLQAIILFTALALPAPLFVHAFDLLVSGAAIPGGSIIAAYFVLALICVRGILGTRGAADDVTIPTRTLMIQAVLLASLVLLMALIIHWTRLAFPAAMSILQPTPPDILPK